MGEGPVLMRGGGWFGCGAAEGAGAERGSCWCRCATARDSEREWRFSGGGVVASLAVGPAARNQQAEQLARAFRTAAAFSPEQPPAGQPNTVNIVSTCDI